MSNIAVGENIYWVGVNDRTTDLFEGLWPIDNTGISYNAYVIKDEKNVLIDLAKSLKTDDFFNQISQIINISELDYAVINHMEPDHTGIIKLLREINPEIKILCTPKAAVMLNDYYGIKDGVITAADGEKLSIGKKELQFYHIPFVHWPETMATYETSDKILFSCDAFGGYGALPGTIFDDQCKDLNYYERESLRYYANIVAKFSPQVLNAIEKLSAININTIAPSHGLIWRKNPERIIELYKKWAQYSVSGGEKGITLLYGTMYGNTELMMNAVAEGAASTGLNIEIFDVSRIHPGYILPSLLANKGVIVGAPTYETTLFPYMQQVLEKSGLKNIKNKKAVYFGSYGWSKGALKKTLAMTEPLGWEFISNIEFAGAPKDEDLKAGYELGKKLALAL